MVYVKLLNENGKLPQRNNPTDIGADLFSAEDTLIPAGQRRFIGTGIAIQAINNPVSGLFTYFRIAPRSGLAFKNGIDVLAGVVDFSYRGELRVGLLNTSDEDFHVEVGMKIAQLIREVAILDDYVIVDNLDTSDRGEKGFGSSGV